MAPPAWNTNVSLLSAAPARLSKPLNATPPTVPEPAPEIVHVESALGPLSVSVPDPPSTVTGTPAADNEASMENVSLPSPPVIESPVTDASGLLVTVPSIVTTRFEPSTVTETVCEAPSGSVIVQADGVSVVVVPVAAGVVVVPLGVVVSPVDVVWAPPAAVWSPAVLLEESAELV